MPCNSDYLDSTKTEAECQRAAKLIVYTCEALGQVPAPSIVKAANDQYCTDDYLIPLLCAKLSVLKQADLDRIVYNPYDRTARDLANWWEDHREADRKRKKLYAVQNRIVVYVSGAFDAENEGEAYAIADKIHTSIRKIEGVFDTHSDGIEVSEVKE